LLPLLVLFPCVSCCSQWVLPWREDQLDLGKCNCQQPVPKVLGPAIWKQVFLISLCSTLIQKMKFPQLLPEPTASTGSNIFTFVLYTCQKDVSAKPGNNLLKNNGPLSVPTRIFKFWCWSYLYH
jgi:hypothetical protein